VKVNAKGQIVIPAELRGKWGIKPGDEVEFRPERGRLVLVKTGPSKIRKWAGKYAFEFPSGVRTSDEFVERLRGR
jgi:AbrB family looped-hinge helix DNA binding protein